MKKIILLIAITLSLLSISDTANAAVYNWDTGATLPTIDIGGGVMAYDWDLASCWGGSGPPPRGAAHIANITADGVYITDIGVPTWNELPSTVNLNAGIFYLQGDKQTKFQDNLGANMNIGNGDAADGLASVLFPDRWGPAWHGGGPVNVNVKSDGTLEGGQIRGRSSNARYYHLNIEQGGVASINTITLTVNNTADKLYLYDGGRLEIGTTITQGSAACIIELEAGSTVATRSGSAGWTTGTNATLTGTGMVTFEINAANPFTWTGSLTGTAGILKSGDGTWSAPGSNYTYTGATGASGGVLDLTAGGTFASTQIVAGADAAATTTGTLLMDGNDTSRVPNLNEVLFTGGILQMQNADTGTFITPITVEMAGGTLLPEGGAWTLTNASTVTLNAGGVLTLDGTTAANDLQGVVAGTGGIAKSGTGSWTLSADNTYNGDTAVNAGVLDITGNNTGTGDTNVDAGIYNLVGTCAGTGNLNVNTGGTANITGAWTKTGDTNVDGGIYNLTGTCTGTGDLNVSSGGIANITSTWAKEGDTNVGAGTYNLLGSSTGTGNLNVNTGGTANIIGTWDKTGDTNVDGGTLEFTGSSTGAGNLNVTNNGTANISSTWAKPGDTNVTQGTLNVTGTLYNAAGTGVLTVGAAGTLNASGTLYDGSTSAAIVAAGGATLDFTGSTFGLADNSSLRLNLGNGVNFSTFPSGSQLNTDLQLQGSYTGYNASFARGVAGSLNTLSVDTGTPFAIDIDHVTGGTLNVAQTATLDKNDLTVNLTGFGAITSNTPFDVLVTGSGILENGGASWSTFVDENNILPISHTVDVMPAGTILNFYYEGNKLYGKFTVLGGGSEGAFGTNPNAMGELVGNTPTSGDSQKIRNQLLAEDDLVKRDQMVQQFTPSMAAANVAQMEQVHSQILEQVAQRIVIPWQSGLSNKKILRGQNYYYAPRYRVRYAGAPDAAWFQTFGYSAQQEARRNSAVAATPFAGYEGNGWGFSFGFDKKLSNDSLLLGLAFAYTNNDLNSTPFVSGSLAPANVQTETYTMLGYGVMKTGRKTFVACKAGGTWAEVEGLRHPFINDPTLYTYETNSTSWFAQMTLGWNWIERPVWSITPKARLACFGYNQDAFTENRGVGVTSGEVGAFANSYTKFDLVADTSVSLSATATFDLSIGYRGLVGAEGAALTSQADGLTYQVNGIATASHLLLLDLGGAWSPSEGLTLVGEYNFRAGEGGLLNGGTATLVMAF